MGKGFKKQIKSFIGKKGTPVKTGTVEFEEIISKNPEEITKTLLGPDATIADTNSFESIWKAMQRESFPWKKHKDVIINHFANGLKNDGLPYPSELGLKENRMKKFSEIKQSKN